MQSINQPAKFLVPFAQNDSAKVEIPATTPDATRMSQSLGSPPLTGMPPEAGGVPPQLEDFNGAMNQIARGIWWAIGGGRFGFDATWAGDPLINGYARGAVLPAALGSGTVGLGEWINNTEDNLANPDTTGTGWVPGYHYGATALTGQTGGTVTLSPAQAGKRVITVAGTLTSNLILVVPGWVYDWTVFNNTGGAFTVTVKNAATPGVVIPQNGAPTPVRCDGAACTTVAPNIGAATSSTQAMQLGQAEGRLITAQKFALNATYTPSANARFIIVELVGGGGGGGGVPAVSGAQCATSGGGGGGAYCKFTQLVPGAPVAITIGAGGSGGIGGVSGGLGTAGGTTSFGAIATVEGGAGGTTVVGAATAANFRAAGGQGGTNITAPSSDFLRSTGARGGEGLSFGNGGAFTDAVGGYGGGSAVAQNGAITPTAPTPSAGGAGGVGAASGPGGGGQVGQNGAPGFVIVYEYS